MNYSPNLFTDSEKAEILFERLPTKLQKALKSHPDKLLEVYKVEVNERGNGFVKFKLLGKDWTTQETGVRAFIPAECLSESPVTNINNRFDESPAIEVQAVVEPVIEAHTCGRETTIEKLKSLGYAPIPVAPKQCPIKYPLKKNGKIVYEKDGITPKPLFTGKNPSYLTADGKPVMVFHNTYQNRPPTASELALWFTHPATGIGTLGGVNGSVWIDFDHKGTSDLESRFHAWLDKFPHLRESWIEQTHSGGYRVLVKSSAPEKEDTNFALTSGGIKVGEALGAGRFTVLAPTIGPSGNTYRKISDNWEPVGVDSLESIGIFPTKTPKPPRASKTITPARIVTGNSLTSAVALTDLLSKNATGILYGEGKSDRSEALTVLMHEVYGWVNWCGDHMIPVTGSPEDLATVAGTALGLDDAKIDRILETIDGSQDNPSVFSHSGVKGCWQVIRRADKDIFETLCPADIKAEILADWKAYSTEDWEDASQKCRDAWGNLGDAEKNKQLDNLLIDYVSMVSDSEIDLLLTQLGLDAKAEYPRICFAVNVLRTNLRAENRLIEAADFKGDYFWKVLKSHKNEYDYLRLVKKFKGRLRFNLLKKQAEIDGKPLESDDTTIDLAIDHGVELQSPIVQVPGLFLKVAKTFSYHPIKDYLDRVANEVAPNFDLFNSMATRYFHNSGEIQNVMVKKFLIAAVARIFEPGCKVDTVLILHGPQGYFKSTALKTLAGKENFEDHIGSVSEKDELMKMHKVWFVEWAELEAILGKKETATTKAFLTSDTDNLRMPYARTVQEVKRASVICGSTNEDEFLSDATGNRRFWIVSMTDKIDIKGLERDRDILWSTAVHCYLRGDIWYLSPEEDKLAHDAAANYQTIHPWTKPIVNFAKNYPHVTTGEILAELGIEIGHQKMADSREVAKILKMAGWVRRNRRVEGRQEKVWVNPNENPQPEKIDF
jgi:predicted P-loop ATPase